MAIGRFISIITLNVNGLNSPIDWLNGYKNKTQIYAVYKTPTSGGWEDGRELGQGDHFLLHKFIERTFERWANSTKQLLNAGRGHQAPRKAAHCLQKEVTSISSLPLLFSTQLCESLCVPNGGEHLGTDYWLDLSLSFSFPPCILLDTPVSFLPLLFSVKLREHLWAVQTVEHT